MLSLCGAPLTLGGYTKSIITHTFVENKFIYSLVNVYQLLSVIIAIRIISPFFAGIKEFKLNTVGIVFTIYLHISGAIVLVSGIVLTMISPDKILSFRYVMIGYLLVILFMIAAGFILPLLKKINLDIKINTSFKSLDKLKFPVIPKIRFPTPVLSADNRVFVNVGTLLIIMFIVVNLIVFSW